MPERTHYEILGVSETASVEEIKKQYRALARKFHPDVNPGPEAARQFSVIAESYRVLSDTESRRLYDADRALKARLAANNFRPHPTAAPMSSNASRVTPTNTSATQEAERLVQQAQTAHVRGRHVEARNLAEQALRYNRRNAQAWEVLGDVCRAQGRPDDALHNYTMAVQVEPRNPALQQKIERLARQPSPRFTPSGHTPNPATRPFPSRPTASGSVDSEGFPPDKRPLARALMGFIGYFGSFLILLFAALQLDRSFRSLGVLPFASSWSWAFVGCLLVTGVLLGATMTITGAVRRIEEDLILSGGASDTKTIPLGIFVLVLGSLFFWAGALLHIAISAIQEALTPSLLRLYGTLALITVLFASVWGVTDGFSQTMLWGGNVVFVGYVVGWLLGDFFRED